MNPGAAQAAADRIRDRRATEGTLGKPVAAGTCWRSECRVTCYYPDACSETTADPTDSLAAGFRDVTGVTA